MKHAEARKRVNELNSIIYGSGHTEEEKFAARAEWRTVTDFCPQGKFWVASEPPEADEPLEEWIEWNAAESFEVEEPEDAAREWAEAKEDWWDCGYPKDDPYIVYVADPDGAFTKHEIRCEFEPSWSADDGTAFTPPPKPPEPEVTKAVTPPTDETP